MNKTIIDKDATIASHKQKKLIKNEYSKKNWGLDLSLNELALISATFPSAQQYGPKLQKWIEKTMGWESVKSAEGRGDSRKGDIYIEQKWGIRTDCGPGGLQHRFWQDIHYYLYGHIDDSDSENITVDIYLLTKEQAIEESKMLNALPTHGTKGANQLNKNIEYSMSVKYNSEDHDRWKKEYKKSLEELRVL